MADSGTPRYPVIHVTSDVGINEPGIVSIHDEATGQTYYADRESYLDAIRDNSNK